MPGSPGHTQAWRPGTAPTLPSSPGLGDGFLTLRTTELQGALVCLAPRVPVTVPAGSGSLCQPRSWLSPRPSNFLHDVQAVGTATSFTQEP